MSHSGHYEVIDGELVRVSDEIPRIASRLDGTYFRDPYYESFNGRNGTWITSKAHKKAEMARRGIREYEESARIEGKPEKMGKIYSYNGQPNRSRRAQKDKPIPAHLQHYLQTKMDGNRA